MIDIILGHDGGTVYNLRLVCPHQSQKLKSFTEVYGFTGFMDYLFRIVICPIFVLWRLLGYELGK